MAGLLCAGRLYERHLKKQGRYCRITAVSAWRGENTACLLLRPLCQPGDSTVVAAASAGTEGVLCWVRLWLLRQPGEDKRVCGS